MERLPEEKIEMLAFMEKYPFMITGALYPCGVNNLMARLISDYGESVTEVYITLEDENQMTIVAKNVDAEAFEDLFLYQERLNFHYLLVVMCEAVSIRLDHFYLQSFQGVCTYSSTEESTKAELTAKFKIRKDRLFEGHNISYADINRGLQQLAALHPGVKIVFEQSFGEQQRNVYCYPRGIFDYFDFEMDLMSYHFVRGALRFYLETSIDNYHYRICFNFCDVPRFRTFTNNEELDRESSLQEGILKGLMMGIQEAARQDGHEVILGRAMLMKTINCMAVVNGEEFPYMDDNRIGLGLVMPEMEAAVSRYVANEIVHFDENQRHELVYRFIKR